MDIPTVEQVSSLLQLITPGIIITAIRARAVTGIAPELKDKILEFGVVSIIYGALATPVFHSTAGPVLPDAIWVFLYSVAAPILIGIVLAYISGYKLLYKAADAIRLPIAHHLPTAWDYTFESLPSDTFLLVTLGDGTTIPGKMSQNSFASSNKDERDLLIQEVWEIDEQGTWSLADPPRSMLICGKDIRLVEVF
jgi:Family of unknown function (DUF6338)